MSSLMCTFFLSLFLTLLFELFVAAIFRVRGKDLLLVILVNVLTNPAAVLFSVLAGNRKMIQLFIEAVVILTEGCYYKKYSGRIKNGFWLSAVANVVSYGLGLLLHAVRWLG